MSYMRKKQTHVLLITGNNSDNLGGNCTMDKDVFDVFVLLVEKKGDTFISVSPSTDLLLIEKLDGKLDILEKILPTFLVQ